MPSFKDAIGMLTKDPVVRDTDKCKVVSFTVASSTYNQGKPTADYVEVVVFVNNNDTTKQIDVVNKLYKGRFVVILHGEIKYNTYMNKENVEVKKEQVYLRSMYDIIMDPTVDKLKSQLAAQGDSDAGGLPSGEFDPDDEIPI